MENKKLRLVKIISGVVFLLLFFIVFIRYNDEFENEKATLIYILEILLAGIGINLLLPKSKKKEKAKGENYSTSLSKRTLFSVLSVLVLVPATIFFGIYFLDDKKYYFISILIILEIILPFIISFERKKSSSRELVIISVLCALGVCSRTAFYMLPQIKPVLAVIIISGVAFGGETGFLVGVVTAFVSNFYFGQGAWTPWQMFVYGLVGFLGGILTKKSILPKTKTALSLFGFFVTVFVYGIIINSASLSMMQLEFSLEAIMKSCIAGLPYDVLLGVSTSFFLWFMAEPVLEKLERVKNKYGLNN